MSTRMLYVHVVNVGALTANAIQVLKMCQAFSNAGLELTLAIPKNNNGENEHKIKKSIEKKIGSYPSYSIITFKNHTFFNKFKLLACYFPVKRLMQEIKPDVVFLRNIVLVRAAIKTNTPFIYESHNSLMHNNSSFLNNYWTNYILSVSSSVLMKKFVTISDALGKFWIDKGMPKNKVLSIHDGFDEEKFKSPLKKNEARKILGLPNDKKIILYMGSLYKDREIDRIINMAENLKEVYFLIVGGSKHEQKFYSDIAKKQDVININFWGSVDHNDIPTYLYAADILLMVWSKKVKTINYCSPLKLFEYMAAGRIIVGQGFRTIKEVLVDGEDAYLADPESSSDLLKKLILALEKESEEFGEKARKKAFDQYTWGKRVKAILASSFDSTQ